jgi:DNA-binding transcriptional LysR family regulator
MALISMAMCASAAAEISAHIKTKRLKRVLTAFSPTFPGFYLYYPSRRNQSTKLKAFIDFTKRRTV